MIIGGIAVIARGVRRFTTDIDAAVRGDAIAVEALFAELARSHIEPRIDDALAFARANLVLLMRHEPTGVDLDVSLAWSTFELEAIAASTTAPFGRVRAPMSTAEDLVVLKAIAGRAKDVDDIEALLTMHRIDLARVRTQVAALAALAESPELVTSFDAIAARAGASVALPAEPAKSPPRPRRPSGRK